MPLRFLSARLICFCAAFLPAVTYASGSQRSFTHPDFDLEGNIGSSYRRDQLQWNIASDTTGGATPNILSELTWRDVDIAQINAGTSYIARRGMPGLYLEASGYYGAAIQGKNQDSDYAGNNRTGEFSRSYSDAGGDVYGFSGALGYAMGHTTEGNGLRIVPMVGYAADATDFTMRNGLQVVGGTPGHFAGLDSKYNALWRGPFVGMAMRATVFQKHTISLRGEYHFVDYYADADWNLRSDFMHPKSFEHDATGNGVSLALGYEYVLNKKMSLNTSGFFKRFETDAGHDRTFFSNGTTSEIRLNEVQWKSVGATVGASYRF